MSLVLYNTLTKGEEPFVPLEGKTVKMYTCGPTVYGRPHIGNFSSFLMADLLRRWLEVSGFTVIHAKNITDVGHLVADADQGEDKIQKQAKAEKTDPLAIARKYTEQYLEDERLLGLLEPQFRPKATETIHEMIAIIEALKEKGHAYETEDGIYFAVETFPSYGALSGNTLENLNAGARIDVNEDKRHPADFALWKKTVGENGHHLLRWSYPAGERVSTMGDDPHAGFPGWHIECSAMSRKHLGEQLDIHTGGEDNIFPHHECEIAQSECSGKKPFSRYWLHKRRIDMGDVKMSKSLGNVLTVPDIVAKGYSPMDLRYYLLSVHYRTNLKFTWKGMDDAKKARRKIVEWMTEVRTAYEEMGTEEKAQAMAYTDKPQEQAFGHVAGFRKAMDADLNTPGALGILFTAMNEYRSSPPFLGAQFQEFFDLVQAAAQTFGCFEPDAVGEIPAEVQALVAERAAARDKKDFQASDRLRDAIKQLGYDVKDTAEGQKVQKM